MRTSARKLPAPLLLLALVALCGLAGAFAHSERGASTPSATPADFAGVVVMSGFRPLAVDLLWMRAEDLARMRRYYELLSLYNLITALDPHFEAAWVYNSSNLAFRLANLEDSPQKRWRWMREGLLYAVRGFKKNPRSDKICFAIAWIFYYGVPRDDYFIEQVLRDETLNPQRVSVIELARTWAERGYQTRPHVVYIDWLLEFIYRDYGTHATDPQQKLHYLRKRLEIWRVVRQDKPYAANKAAQKIKELKAAISALQSSR